MKEVKEESLRLGFRIDDGRFLVRKEYGGRSHRVSRVTSQRRPEVVVSAEVAGRICMQLGFKEN